MNDPDLFQATDAVAQPYGWTGRLGSAYQLIQGPARLAALPGWGDWGVIARLISAK